MDRNVNISFQGSRARIGNGESENACLRFDEFADVAFYGAVTAQHSVNRGLELATTGHKIIVGGQSYYLKQLIVEHARQPTLTYHTNGKAHVLCNYNAIRIEIPAIKANVLKKIIDYMYTRIFEIDVGTENIAELREGATYLGLLKLSDCLQQVAAHYSARG